MREILIVEDDIDINEALSGSLKEKGFNVTSCFSGASGLNLALNRSFDFIILDVMLPELDGVELCRQIRQKNVTTPVLMLTGKGHELDRVVGLEIGADDYMTKPFSMIELLARIKAMQRRAKVYSRSTNSEGEINYQQIIEVDGIVVDGYARTVTVNGELKPFTVKEFDTLFVLMSKLGEVISRDKLAEIVWGLGASVSNNSINSIINRIRTRIEPNPEEPRYVLTQFGVGYKFSQPSE